MKIANSELLHGPFVHPEQAFRRVRKIMQNYAKMHKNHRKMSTKKYGSRCRNGKKYTPSLDVPECVRCFSGSERVSMILEGSDRDFNTVLLRSPNVFGIFTVHFSRFLAEIHDLE